MVGSGLRCRIQFFHQPVELNFAFISPTLVVVASALVFRSLRLQLADLYFDVMSAEIGPVERTPAPLDIIGHREEGPVRTAAGSVD